MQDLTITSWDQGWGPKNALKLNHHIPYTPFSKTDRIGKIADWAPTAEDSLDSSKRSDDIKGRKRLGVQIEAFGAGVSSAFSYQISASEEADFSIVDRATVAKPKKGGVKLAPVASWGSKASKRDTSAQAKKSFRNSPSVRVRDTSIKIYPDWVQVEELDFARLNSLYFQVDDPVDL